jgi:hypothetical protein
MGSFLFWITVITIAVWLSSAIWYTDRFGGSRGPMPAWMRKSFLWLTAIVIIAWTLWNGKHGLVYYP